MAEGTPNFLQVHGDVRRAGYGRVRRGIDGYLHRGSGRLGGELDRWRCVRFTSVPTVAIPTVASRSYGERGVLHVHQNRTGIWGWNKYH